MRDIERRPLRGLFSQVLCAVLAGCGAEIQMAPRANADASADDDASVEPPDDAREDVTAPEDVRVPVDVRDAADAADAADADVRDAADAPTDTQPPPDVSFDPLPCNGSPCAGACVLLSGGIDAGPPEGGYVGITERGSGAECYPPPPPACRTTAFDTLAPGRVTDPACAMWLRRACDFGTLYWNDATWRYATCSTAGRDTDGAGDLSLRAEYDGAGAMLADMASLEHRAVTAFERLAAELVAHGAPRSLVTRALAAAEHERRHTRALTELATMHGARVHLDEVAPLPLRPLAVVARENAREGCVRESWGALLAAWQSRRAASAHVAGVFASIADDELAHAELSWDLHAWALGALDDDDAGAVRAALDEGVRELGEAVGGECPAWARALGMPSREEAGLLYRGLAERLWAA